MNPDEQAVLLLFSRLGMSERDTGGRVQPYTTRDWGRFCQHIEASPLEGPGALFGMDAMDIQRYLDVVEPEAERMLCLLARGMAVSIEQEGLATQGIRTITIVSDGYPERMRARLGQGAPVVLFYCGDLGLCELSALAIVGSRNVDESGGGFADALSRWAVRGGIPVVSGAARGVDSIAMNAALGSGGVVVGVPADSLRRAIRPPDIRRGIEEERVVMLTPYHPDTPFSVGIAMRRNRLVYSLSEWAVVVSAEEGEGGTSAGATEDLKAGWVPLMVRYGERIPPGNRALIRAGGIPFPPGESTWQGEPQAFLRCLVEQAGAKTQAEEGKQSGVKKQQRPEGEGQLQMF